MIHRGTGELIEKAKGKYVGINKFINNLKGVIKSIEIIFRLI